MNIDPNWWRAVIAPIAVTSGLIVAACISGLPSSTCAALAKTYINAVHNFGFSALFASAMFLFCMFVSAATDSGQSKIPTHVVGIVATIAAAFIFAWAISAGTGSLNKSIADCYPGSPQGQLKPTN
jgi:hypothetical protein